MSFPPVQGGNWWAVVGLSGTRDEWLHTVEPILMPAAVYLAPQNLVLAPTTSTPVGFGAATGVSEAPPPNAVGDFETKGCDLSPAPKAVSMTRDAVLQESPVTPVIETLPAAQEEEMDAVFQKEKKKKKKKKKGGGGGRRGST